MECMTILLNAWRLGIGAIGGSAPRAGLPWIAGVMKCSDGRPLCEDSGGRAGLSWVRTWRVFMPGGRAVV